MDTRDSRTSLTPFRRDRWLNAYFEALAEGASREEALDFAEDQSRVSLEFE